MVFGRLTVLERADDYISKSGYKQVQWKCKCNCINKTILVVSGNDLKTGNTKSCGCYKKEMTSAVHKKYNPIEYCEDYMIMYDQYFSFEALSKIYSVKDLLRL
jgi:hypothetical protein